MREREREIESKVMGNMERKLELKREKRLQGGSNTIGVGLREHLGDHLGLQHFWTKSDCWRKREGEGDFTRKKKKKNNGFVFEGGDFVISSSSS